MARSLRKTGEGHVHDRVGEKSMGRSLTRWSGDIAVTAEIHAWRAKEAVRGRREPHPIKNTLLRM